MIWGRTNAQIVIDEKKEKENKKEKSGKWLKYFAYSPIRLHDGRMLWLQWYNRQEVYEWSNSGHEYCVVTNREKIL